MAYSQRSYDFAVLWYLVNKLAECDLCDERDNDNIGNSNFSSEYCKQIQCQFTREFDIVCKIHYGNIIDFGSFHVVFM